MAKWEVEQGDLFDHGKTTCAHCGNRIYIDDAYVKTVHIGLSTKQEHFCDAGCHRSWYINYINPTEG